jgi:hypothetical protein
MPFAGEKKDSSLNPKLGALNKSFVSGIKYLQIYLFGGDYTEVLNVGIKFPYLVYMRIQFESMFENPQAKCMMMVLLGFFRIILNIILMSPFFE